MTFMGDRPTAAGNEEYWRRFFAYVCVGASSWHEARVAQGEEFNFQAILLSRIGRPYSPTAAYARGLADMQGLRNSSGEWVCQGAKHTSIDDAHLWVCQYLLLETITSELRREAPCLSGMHYIHTRSALDLHNHCHVVIPKQPCWRGQ